MSNGVTHLNSSLILAAALSTAAMISQDVRLLECAGGALVGIFISPDLDLSNEGIVQGRFIKRRFGNPILKAWKYFWRGYSGSFKHGQFASHFPIFSTFTRITYIYFWLILVPHTLIKLLGFFQWELMYVLQWYGILFMSLPFFYGLASSDLIHWTLDKLTTEKK